MKRWQFILAAAACLTVFSATAAVSAEFDIPINTIVVAEPGTVTVLRVVDTPPELVGASCVGIAVASNQDSVHPNNDLIIASGGEQVVILDVEREPDVSTPVSGDITLGETVTVSLRMGSDKVFSGGMVIEIGDNCTPPTTTSTTSTSTTSTTSTSTTSTTSTTTTEPPVVGPAPQIMIEKDETETYIDEAGVGHFSITVTNPGPVDLIDVHVTDDLGVAMDPGTDCVNPDIGDLAVFASFTYECTVANLSVNFYNEATAIGTDREGTEVTATDDATVLQRVESTTLTQPSTTTTAATEETLPVTGVAAEEVRGFAATGVVLVLGGILLLAGAALIGRVREE